MTASVSSVRLDYFYGSEVRTGTFFRVPKVFEAHAVYSAASIEVKYLYGIMLDRVSISARNGWLDDGRVFIYFTLDEVKKCIRAGKNKAVQAIHDMETLGLIQRKKQGQGKPTRIFLKNIIEEKAEQPNPNDMPNSVPAVFAKTINNVEAAGGVETVDEIPAQSPVNSAENRAQDEDTVMPMAAVNSEPAVARNEKWDAPAPVSDSAPCEIPPARDSVTPSLPDCMDYLPTFGDQCAQTNVPTFENQCAQTNVPMFGDGCVQTSVSAFWDKCARDGLNEAVQTAPAATSVCPESGSQDFPNRDTNYNNRNYNKKNYTDSNDINLSPPTPSPRRVTLPPATRQEMEEDKRECREFVRESIGYELLLREYPGDARTINGYVEILTETLCNEGPYIRIGQQEYSVYEVRERLYQLSHEHICYVLDCMKNTSTKIINMRAYTLTALFNAPLTVDQYYENLVNQDFAESGSSYGRGYGYGGCSHSRYTYGRRAG